MPAKRLDQKAGEWLKRRAWPGNVRELQHAMERAFILSGTAEFLRVEHFSRSPGESEPGERRRHDVV
jgi:two-component system NtrC family response regulator